VQDSKLKCVFVDEQPSAVVPNESHEPRGLDAVSYQYTVFLPRNSVNIHSLA